MQKYLQIHCVTRRLWKGLEVTRSLYYQALKNQFPSLHKSPEKKREKTVEKFKFSKKIANMMTSSSASCLNTTTNRRQLTHFRFLKWVPASDKNRQGWETNPRIRQGKNGYWLRSYWFYCVTVGLEVKALPWKLDYLFYKSKDWMYFVL